MLIKSFFMVFTLLIGSFSVSLADFIIPININKTPKKIIKVAKANGDFTTINAALSSISDANANNRYLIYVAPGTYYDVPIIMKEYVDITGSGEGVTVISGALSSDDYSGKNAIVVGASNTTLSNLTVQNAGLSGNYSCAMYIDDKSMTIDSVTLKAIGTADKNYALFAITDASSIIKNVTALAIGSGENNVAIDIEHSSSERGDQTIFENVMAKAINATTFNAAISNNRANIIVRRSILDATDYGVYSADDLSKTVITHSGIIREVTGDSVKCAACDDGAGSEVDSSCNNDVNSI